MSIDVIERRRAVEERLRRARNLTQALEQATADIASGSGLTIDDIDPAGSLRTAVSTLAGVAALRPGFDILVSLPDSPFALRLRHLTDDVNIELIRHHTSASDQPAAADPAAADPPAARDSPALETASGIPNTGTLSDLPETAETAEPEGHVASDLAAMLWQDVGPPP